VLNGTQILTFSKDTIPLVAKALSFALSAQVKICPVSVNHMKLMHFFGSGVNLYIHERDWLKIKEGLTSSILTPVRQLAGLSDTSAINFNYTRRYEHVKNTLTLIFDEE
jgi:hypothetical protein